MSLATAADVKNLHASFGSVPELLEQRRSVYSVAIELFQGSTTSDVSDAVLDNPAVRAHLGDVLGGTAQLDPGQLVPIDELVTVGAQIPAAAACIGVASSLRAVEALAPAVSRLTDQLLMYGEHTGPRMLTAADPSFDRAFDSVRDGVELAMRTAPELVSDLLPHVALIAIFARAESGRLGSASSRDHPGLIMVPEPQSDLEMAEALVHEGAHQKFFDLAITRALMGPDASEARYFRPPWASAGAPSWPLEQCFAAFHAYALLAVFHRELRRRREIAHGDLQCVPPEGSLLPVAEQRAKVIGDWLVEQGRFLASDGRRLVELMHGVRPESPDGNTAGGPIGDPQGRADVVKQCAGRTLVARAGSPVEMYWLTGSSR